MIETVKIEGYRLFQKLDMHGLRRVNLLVGSNNSGKTSALEALYLLASYGNQPSILRTLFQIIVGRVEQRLPDLVPQGVPMIPELEFGHLFYGHQIRIGSSFRLTASNSTPPPILEFKIVEAKPDENPQLFSAIDQRDAVDALGSRLALSINISEGSEQHIPAIPLTARAGLRQDAFQTGIFNVNNIGDKAESHPVNFVSTTSLGAQELRTSWGSIALTKDEERVITALKSLDPKIERIAATTTPLLFPMNRGGFIVKMSDVEQPIPIGSLGDGVWRMLALAIVLVRSRNGTLLIDEIDTGLHYTALATMWKMVIDAAKTFNIQVFATTHNSDCIKALASTDDKDISVQRIESGALNAVCYSAAEARIAAEHNIEVR